MVNRSRARRLRYFIGLASLLKSPCSFGMFRGTENMFRHHAEQFYWYPLTKREQDFRFGEYHITPFLLAANTVQVLLAFQTLVCRITSKPFVSLLCLSVWDRLQSVFPENTFFFGRLPSACGEQNCHLVQPTAYFPAFHLACWQSFLSLQNHFFYSGSAFSEGANKNLSVKNLLKSSFVSDRCHTQAGCLFL